MKMFPPSFKDIIAELRSRWSLVLNVLLGVALFISLVVFAVQIGSLRELRDRVDRHFKRYEEMVKLKEKVPSGPRQNVAKALPAGQSLMSIVNELVNKENIQYETIEPGSPVDRGTYLIQSVKLKFKGVAFDRFMRFLNRIENYSKVRMSLVRVSIEKNIKGDGINAVVEVEAPHVK